MALNARVLLFYFMGAPIPDFTGTSSTKYCCLMHPLVQVPMPIHRYTVECEVKIN